jgi:hypothetical protein
MSVNQDVLRMPAGTRRIETVTIDVPKRASAGERYAVVWAEVAAPAPASGGVTLVTRVGVRVYLSVGPGGALPSNFALGALTAKRLASGQPAVVARVHNSGKRTLDVTGHLILSKGPGGLRAGPFAIKLGTLAPGNSRLVTVRLDNRLPRGPWRAHMQLRSGFLQRGASARIVFPRQSVAGRVRPSESGLGIILAAVVGFLSAVAVTLLLVRRRHPRRSGDVMPAASPVR